MTDIDNKFFLQEAKRYDKEQMDALRRKFPGKSDEELNDPNLYQNMAREQVRKKFGIGERQQLTDQLQSEASGTNWQAGLTGLGATLQRRDPTQAIQSVQSTQQNARNQRLGAFDKTSELEDQEILNDINAVKRGKDMAVEAEEQDPNSAQSKIAQDLALKMGLDPEAAKGLTAAKFKTFSPSLEKRYEIEQRRLQREAEAKMRAEDRKEAKDARTELQNRTRDDKLAEKAKLSDKQVAQVTEFDDALNAVDNIAAQKKNFDTGPVASGAHTVASWFGAQDPKKAAFKAEVGDQLAQYIKSISGGAVSKEERASLLANTPSMSDNDEVFEEKLNVIRKKLAEKRATMLKNAELSGKTVPKEFKREDQPAKESAPPVRMQGPDGKVRLVPPDQVEAAKAAGGKVL